MLIREAKEKDWLLIWPIFQDIVEAGETYGYERATTFEQGRQIWLDSPFKTYVAEEKGEILGTYYIKSNQAGPGSHVCNCGYMVAPAARGRGMATIMCEHSQKLALEFGYKTMQFNFVALSNTSAIRLWHKLGFITVGRLPNAFNHPTHGLIDALVMFKTL